jgi:hypothetical protein
MANEFVIKNGYFSQGNSNVTGSLRVSGSIGVIGSGSDVLSVYGSQGNLLVVNDTFSGSLFTITDVSGYPILDIISDYYTSHIEMIGTASLTGSLSITQDLDVGQNLTASKALFSSSNNNQLMVMGSGSSSWITGIYGSQGNLLTVTDTMSGSLFTTTDISGYPIFKITSDHYTNRIEMIGTASLTGSLSITQDLTASKALFSSSNGDQLIVIGSGSTLTQIYGSQGSLLTANDTFSGSIFTVTDISGYPLFKVTSDHYTSRIEMIGTASLTGSLSITQAITASKALFSSSNNNQLVVAGSGSSLVQVYGSQGNLLTVNDTFSGSIFTVTDISGYPILDITSDYYTGSVFLPTLTTSSQQYIVTYNSESGQLFYTASSAVGGGGPSTFNSTSSIIGNGALATWDINHGFNTRNLHITVYESSSNGVTGNGETVYPDIRRINNNTASIIFANPPLTNQYIVYISQ